MKVIDPDGLIAFVHPAQLDVGSAIDNQAAPPLGTSDGNDVYEQIRRLAELHKEGVISSEEFENKKAELLKRI